MMGLSRIGNVSRKSIICLSFGIMECWNDGIMGLVEKKSIFIMNADLLRFYLPIFRYSSIPPFHYRPTVFYIINAI
jgi:hypothetical protein